MTFTKRGKWGTSNRTFRVNHGKFYRPTSVTVLGVNSRKLASASRSASRSRNAPKQVTVPISVEVGPQKTKRTAYILWLFSGFLGGHRYYLGRPVTGFLMTITLGGFLVWWLVDLLLIPSMID